MSNGKLELVLLVVKGFKMNSSELDLSTLEKSELVTLLIEERKKSEGLRLAIVALKDLLERASGKGKAHTDEY